MYRENINDAFADFLLKFKYKPIETYKYLNSFYDVERPQFTMSSMPNLRGHSRKLANNRSRLDVRSHFFSNRIVEV